MREERRVREEMVERMQARMQEVEGRNEEMGRRIE
jgi:hypothetical protein